MDPPEEQLKYIREVMSRSSTFTAVPGWGAVLMGISALTAAVTAANVHAERFWLMVWLVDAIIAAAIGLATLVRKARLSQAPLKSGAGRKFISGFLPALFAGAVLTLAFWRADHTAMLPGAWMLMYGIGVWTGGSHSVRIIPIMGMLFVAAGTLTLFLPEAWNDAMMAASFGGLHLGFGCAIIRHYGG